MACPLQKPWFFEPTKRLQPHDNGMMRFHVMQCLLGWVFMCVYAVAEHATYSLNRTHFTEHNNVTICHPYSTAITLGCQTSLHRKPDESKGQARPGNLLSAMSAFVREITWNLLRKMIKHFIQHVKHSASVRMLGRKKYLSKSLTFIHLRRMPRFTINYIQRTQRKPFQRPPRHLGILQGLHEGWCCPGYRTSRISQGLEI